MILSWFRKRPTKGAALFGLLVSAVILLGWAPLLSAADTIPIPSINIGVGTATNPNQVATTLEIVLLLTILTLAPAILVMITSFTRVIVVLSFIRHALGTQQMPPNQVLVGLALFLTFFIMAPTWSKVYSQAVAPYMAEKITVKEAYDKAMVPLRDFMFRQVKERDLGLFVRLAKIKEPRNRKDIPTYVLVPAFVTSELATAFEIGFLIFIPFLIIDLVIASILMSMGMLMLPPVMISLPFKLLLFVLVDGWSLMISSLVRSFG